MELTTYRDSYLSAAAIVSKIASNPSGAHFFDAVTGVGKTRLLGDMILRLHAQGTYRRIFYATSRHRIIEEMAGQLHQVDPIVQVRRNDSLCGPERASEWRRLHDLNLGILGKTRVCSSCPKRGSCAWYSSKSAWESSGRVYLTTQDYLWATSEIVTPEDIVLLDELRFYTLDHLQIFPREDLEQFVEIVRTIPALYSLIDAAEDLLGRRQPRPVTEHPPLHYRQLYRFLDEQDAYNLTPLLRSAADHRIFHLDASAAFSKKVFTNVPLFIAAFGINQTLLEHVFDRPFTNLSPPFPYRHPDTKVYTIATSSSSFRSFSENPASRRGLIRFALKKIAQNAALGRKTLLVSREDLIPLILKESQGLCQKMGVELVVAKTSDDYDGLTKIPIIHYGIEGINDFEDYFSAICVNAYNIHPDALNETIRKLGLGRDWNIEIRRDGRAGIRLKESVIPSTACAFKPFSISWRCRRSSKPSAEYARGPNQAKLFSQDFRISRAHTSLKA